VKDNSIFLELQKENLITDTANLLTSIPQHFSD
jgi:hypothetical protein